MKVKELIEQLSKLDPERDIWIGYDYPYEIQEPDFIENHESRSWPFDDGKEIKYGDYIHYAE